MRIAILPLARTTFDIPFAEEKLAAMLAALDRTGHEIIGERRLITDAETSAAALATLERTPAYRILVLQITFTDAAFVTKVAASTATPLALWAPNEPRAGGRLRLNAFCGLNLAAHALGRTNHPFSWLYSDPEAEDTDAALAALLAGARAVTPLEAGPPASVPEPNPLAGLHVVQVGAAPDGFATCAYDAAETAARFGARVTTLPLGTLFETARTADAGDVAVLHDAVAETVETLDGVDQDELDRSLRLKLALDELRRDHAADAFALRCWPEAFTEYGGAMCGPVAMMGEARTPCACEADVWGALTQSALQTVADQPVFLVDLVDVDVADDTAVVWHCGQAPPSMAGDTPRATIHTNRRMPLLYEFRLKPGRVTLFRLSQARGTPKVVIASGDVLVRPMAFTGTSGVVRFDAPVGTVLDRVMDSALEHHMALTYGDHRPALQSFAGSLGLGIIDLTEDGAHR